MVTAARYRNRLASLIGLLVALAGTSAWGETRDLPQARLEVPAVDAIKRVDRQHRATPEEQQSCMFAFKTAPHAVGGQAYVIVTDHDEKAFNQPLVRLAEHHGGSMIHVKDLAVLADDASAREDLRSRLRAAKPRFVAIAPRLASYSENLLLTMWEVLSTLDADPQLDAFPGLLVAPNEAAFAALVERSIHHKPQAGGDLRPFVMGQSTDETSVQGQRSLQKVALIRNLFGAYGHSTGSLVTRAYQKSAASQQQPEDIQQPVTEQHWNASMTAPRKFITELPAPARQALDRSSLVIMFGHGVPGATCSLDVSLFHDVAMANKVVLCGSCFSAAPPESDFPPMRRGQDGSEIRNDRERFLMRAVEGGSVVAYGHMRLNGGFPELFPVLESWIAGLTVGEAYQRLMNAIIEVHEFEAGDFILPITETENERAAMRRNILLYTIVGDPALVPLAPLMPVH